MKLKEAREIGSACGLMSDEECIANIAVHCMNLFAYPDIDKEIAELALDCVSNGLDYDKIMDNYNKRFEEMIRKSKGE